MHSNVNGSLGDDRSVVGGAYLEKGVSGGRALKDTYHSPDLFLFSVASWPPLVEKLLLLTPIAMVFCFTLNLKQWISLALD